MTAVEKPIVMGVVGTHSTGKSTFLARLCSSLRREGVQVSTVADLGEAAKLQGLPILHNHTWVSTTWFVTRGISLELEAWQHADVVLVDRAVPDALGYFLAALDFRGEEPDPATMDPLEAMVRGHSAHYDLLFQTQLDPSIPLGDNKPRDQDVKFRQLADHHVGQVVQKLALPAVPLRAEGQEQALIQAMEYAQNRLSG